MNFKEAAKYIIENGCVGTPCKECPVEGVSDEFCNWCQGQPQ